MKVLFLDIDGVLNSAQAFVDLHKCPRSESEIGNHLMTYHQIAQLRRIIQETGATIVLTSTWRMGLRREDHRLSAHAILWSHDLRIHDHTAYQHPPGRYPCRGEEIADWLADNEPVENYVILDDSSDMLPEQSPFFVKTDFRTGLTPEIADRVIALLNDKSL